jgi:flagellar M-ring protein FliF
VATVPDEVNTANSTKVQPGASSSSAFGLDKFNQLSQHKKLGIIVAIAATVALLAGAWLWSQSPDYRVLFSNISDQDGAAIINALQQSNVPYKLYDVGGAILVPVRGCRAAV